MTTFGNRNTERSGLNKEGNWKMFDAFAHRVAPNLPELGKMAQDKFLYEVGKDMVVSVKQHMVNQDLDWTPLHKKYKKSKAIKGQDPRIYIATGFFYDNIVMRVQAKGVVVGVARKKHPETGEWLPIIAKRMEYGAVVPNGTTGKERKRTRYSYIPERPLFRPSRDHAVMNITEKYPLDKIIKANILKLLSR
jgi:hypothetical protein